jgi:hypothetical protein
MAHASKESIMKSGMVIAGVMAAMMGLCAGCAQVHGPVAQAPQAEPNMTARMGAGPQAAVPQAGEPQTEEGARIAESLGFHGPRWP